MDTTLSNIDFEPLTEVKAKLSEKVGRVAETKRLLAVTVNGKPKAILVPYAEFLSFIGQGEYTPRRLSLMDWEKGSKHRKEVVRSVKNMFDLSALNRKGQKPYKADALKKFRKT